MNVTVHEDTEKGEKAEKTTVSVRLDAVPVKTHNKIKKYRDSLIRDKGKVFTLTEAYYEFLKTR